MNISTTQPMSEVKEEAYCALQARRIARRGPYQMGLVMVLSMQENYTFDDHGDPCPDSTYWKHKPVGDRLVAVFEFDDAPDVESAEVARLIDAAIPVSDDYQRFQLCYYKLVPLTHDVIESVKSHIDNASTARDIGYQRYCFTSSAIWDWAVCHLPQPYREIRYY